MNVSENMSALTGQIVDAAYRVHKKLGPGLLEKVYEACLAYELEKKGLTVDRQVIVPIQYDSLTFDEAYRIDLLVEGQVVLEIKATSKAGPTQVAQLLTYMKLSGRKVGLLFCFNNALMKQGITRLVS